MIVPPTAPGTSASEPVNPYPVPPLGDDLAAIEAESGFWASTPQLQLICSTAHARRVGRWALLGAVLANLISWLPPYVALTDKDGRTDSVDIAGSLNFFVHMVDDSADGKTRVMNVAKVLVPPNVDRYAAGGPFPKPDLVPSGTGEGLLKHFVHTVKKVDQSTGETVEVTMQKTDVAVVAVDEVSTYIGELARTGSKTAGTFTSLWSGQLAGTNTSTADNRTRVPAHAARVVLIMLAQPELCGALFSDELIAGGTPQRPLWIPASDWSPCPVTAAPQGVTITPPKSCWKLLPQSEWPQTPPPVTAPAAPTPGAPAVAQPSSSTATANPASAIDADARINTLPPEQRFPRPAASPEHIVWIEQPPQAKADIAAADAARRAAKLSPAQKVALSPVEREARKAQAIQNHMMLTRLKTAVGLALLHGRPNMQPTDQDWVLAGVIMRVSLGMLSYLWVEAQVNGGEKARREGVKRGLTRFAETETFEEKEAREIDEMIDTIWHKLAREKGPRPASEFWDWFSSSRGKKLKVARPLALTRGVIEQDATDKLYYAIDPNTGERVMPPRVSPAMREMAQEMHRQAQQQQQQQKQGASA